MFEILLYCADRGHLPDSPLLFERVHRAHVGDVTKSHRTSKRGAATMGFQTWDIWCRRTQMLFPSGCFHLVHIKVNRHGGNRFCYCVFISQELSTKPRDTRCDAGQPKNKNISAHRFTNVIFKKYSAVGMISWGREHIDSRRGNGWFHLYVRTIYLCSPSQLGPSFSSRYAGPAKPHHFWLDFGSSNREWYTVDEYDYLGRTSVWLICDSDHSHNAQQAQLLGRFHSQASWLVGKDRTSNYLIFPYPSKSLCRSYYSNH
jgi:hypothetical protein